MQDTENKKPEYIWLVYNTTITSMGIEHDRVYLYSAHRDFDKAVVDKKECKAFQKKYASNRSQRGRVFIRRFWLQE